MGGGSSKSQSTIDIVNNAIISAVLDSAQNCGSALSASQTIVRSGLGLFSGTSQSVSVSIACLQKVVVDNQLLTQMAQNIINAAQSNSISMPMASSSSNANQNISNYLSTKITTQFVQNCVANVVANQQAIYGGVQIGVADSQSISYFQSCMSDALNSNNVSQGLVQDTNNSANSQTSSPFSLGLGGLFNFSSTTWIILGIILVVIVAWIVWPMLPSAGRSKEPRQPDEAEIGAADIVKTMPLAAEAAVVANELGDAIEAPLIGAALI
jgi:hypothetical protein